MVNQIRRSQDGMYHIKQATYPELVGSRAQVHNGTAYKTPGGLTTGDLIKNKWGRIVSKAKHESAKKENRLKKHGYTAKKGKFGAVKMSKSKKSKKSKTMKSKK
jgi:hypothetical protein